MCKDVIVKTVQRIRDMEQSLEWKKPFAPPTPRETEEIITAIGAFLFPEFFTSEKYTGRGREEILREVYSMINDRCKKAFDYLYALTDGAESQFKRQMTDSESQNVSKEIIQSFPNVFAALLKDAEAMYEGDPAASSVSEVVLTYPGFFAIFVYRLANLFYLKGIPFLPRIMTEIAHRKTGIDIHPGAKIGESFSIDHGTGVVIGETAVIGDRVKLYQGVTIGAKSFELGADGNPVKGKKRHPEIGSGCIIYAGATILGGDTIIGENSIIGGNVWLTHSLPPGSRVYYK